tara:strand:- start:1722 stop:2450 length:729 start_codon:yes stop_codon:yes gene_type:complete
LKGKKKIRRRKSGTRLYFTKETQEFIQKYQNTDCGNEKNKIYVEKIFTAFDKLAENLIFVYGFITPQDDYLSLKSDCVSFLYETIAKWDPARGTKAFSYFNVVAKNWLIMHARNNKKHARRNVSLSDINNMNMGDKQCLANYDFVPPPDEILIYRNMKNEILEIVHQIKNKVTGQKEKACIDAIMMVFKNVDELDFLNKRAVFIYVRDISGLNPKQLSVAMSSIRKHYKEIVKERRELEGLL